MVSAFVATLGVSVGTAAAQGNEPRTEPVTGTFTAAPVERRQRVCEGEDGLYVEIRARYEGTSVSSDPRLTGNIEFTAAPGLINLATGVGTFQGRFRITDAETGQQTAQGEFHTVVTPILPPVGRSRSDGFALGKVMNQGAGPTDDVFANLTSTFDNVTLETTGQFGAADADPRRPAVIQGGHCTGPFTNVDLP
jgi:hypothetical protein